ncbi:MAG TPA: cytochrome b6-f complex subunit PetG [Stenomitos sp.]
MQEPILHGMVLGLIPITILGLLANAYQQQRRSNHLLEQIKTASQQKEDQDDLEKV